LVSALSNKSLHNKHEFHSRVNKLNLIIKLLHDQILEAPLPSYIALQMASILSVMALES
jgi:hypothetical protein